MNHQQEQHTFQKGLEENKLEATQKGTIFTPKVEWYLHHNMPKRGSHILLPQGKEFFQIGALFCVLCANICFHLT